MRCRAGEQLMQGSWTAAACVPVQSRGSGCRREADHQGLTQQVAATEQEQ